MGIGEIIEELRGFIEMSLGASMPVEGSALSIAATWQCPQIKVSQIKSQIC